MFVFQFRFFVWPDQYHSTKGSSTLNPQRHGTLDSNMRPWFKNASAYSTSTCPSRSKMPKSAVRAEIFIPEAQNFFVERFLRDLFNTPGHGSVCGGGRHQIGQPILFEKQIGKNQSWSESPKNQRGEVRLSPNGWEGS